MRQDIHIKKLEDRVEQLEMEKRAHNLIIDGCSEDPNENIRAKVGEIFGDLELDFGVDRCDSIHRLGPRRPGIDRPRPILVVFPFLRLKSQVFRNAHKLRNMEKYKKTYLSDDLPPKIQSERRDLRSIHALARVKGINSKLRGGSIVIDEIRYSYADINNLPHDLTLENAKTVTVEDGVAFQGHHAFMSSLYRCEIKYNGNTFYSAESALHYTHATVVKQKHVAEKIINEKEDMYEVMRLGRKLPTNDAWKQQELTVFADIHAKKYEQNPHLKEKLKKTKGHLYEATKHPVYGAGFTLTQRHLIKQENVKTGNKLGITLENLCDNYLKDNQS